jgi:hypothetical protein
MYTQTQRQTYIYTLTYTDTHLHEHNYTHTHAHTLTERFRTLRVLGSAGAHSYCWGPGSSTAAARVILGTMFVFTVNMSAPSTSALLPGIHASYPHSEACGGEQRKKRIGKLDIIGSY